MITIRELWDKDMLEAIQLKALCLPEELAGMSEEKLNIEKEYSYWTNWMHAGIENNDVRALLGAFENDKMLGVAFVSYAEIEDSNSGIELNGLWVYPEMRGRGISLMLISKILDYYEKLGLKEIIVYNYHNSSSNSFYRKLGAKVFKTELQMDGKIPTDVFKCDIPAMIDYISKSTVKYKMDFY
ncbi:GNAT family N-acetyltransferase [Anaerocolumna xylanovorans]|uniref:GNAT family N-acetyltransferase n=1 Tax=Anaerocolumna xylanovorans TaxID=100134 RepID=UPI000937F70D|nr:GNAT family N-acetyltransferase [Anaerocolumna xylanovorans]